MSNAVKINPHESVNIGEDLWPTKFNPAPDPLPIDLLKRQANLLSNKTQGKVEGGVIANHGYRGSETYYDGDFYLFSPELGYRYRLFSLHFDPLQPFPVTVVSSALTGEKREARTVAEYQDVLREVFHSDTTHRVVGFILNFSDNETNNNED